jgi:hypothetical protein
MSISVKMLRLVLSMNLIVIFILTGSSDQLQRIKLG